MGKNQRAVNGGSDLSWLKLAFLGRPDFPSRGPQIPIFKGFGDLWTENRGAPKAPISTTTDLTPHLRPSEKMILAGEFPAIPLSAVKIASEQRRFGALRLGWHEASEFKHHPEKGETSRPAERCAVATLDLRWSSRTDQTAIWCCKLQIFSTTSSRSPE